LLRKAISCFGCSRNVNVSFVVTSAAALNEDLRLEVAAACAFDIVAYMVAVLLRRELASVPSIGIELQTRLADLTRLRLDAVDYRHDFCGQRIGLLLARARVLVAKVVVGQFLSSPTPACWLGMAPPGGTATDVPRLT
jgi:hypothetical protein